MSTVKQHEPYGTITDETGRPFFDVTATIGRVYLDGSDSHPHIVAMQMIGQHTLSGAAGTFYFPAEDGSMCVVSVDFERKPKADS